MIAVCHFKREDEHDPPAFGSYCATGGFSAMFVMTDRTGRHDVPVSSREGSIAYFA